MKVPAHHRLEVSARPAGRARKGAPEGRAVSLTADGWNHGGELAQRCYASYDEYLDHQSSKLAGNRRPPARPQTSHATWRIFSKRFRDLPPRYGKPATVLCLGAPPRDRGSRRCGQLGHLAIGIDLNPGADNVYVLHGDFSRPGLSHRLVRRRLHQCARPRPSILARIIAEVAPGC